MAPSTTSAISCPIPAVNDMSLTAGIGQDIALVVEGAKMGLNYGLDKVRFLSPVPVDSEIRMHSKVVDITEKNPGQFLVKSEVTMEIKGTDKPVCQFL